MKIEFGAGTKLTRGYVGCDIRPLEGIRYVCPCWDIDKHVEANSVEEIYSRHMFEHLTFRQGIKSLVSWHRVLRSEGKVKLSLPDLFYHVNEYLRFFNDREDRSKPSFIHAIAGMYGWQKEAENSPLFSADKNTWGIHKSGYDERSLKELVQNHGFKNFTRIDGQPWNLDVVFYKA